MRYLGSTNTNYFFLLMKNADPPTIESLLQLDADDDAVERASVKKEASYIRSVYRALIDARDSDASAPSQSRSY
jgi:hypothetical protein